MSRACRDIALILFVTLFLCWGARPSLADPPYPIHRNITATIFWIGEGSTKGHGNVVSAWDRRWVEHYGGVDSPYDRFGFFP